VLREARPFPETPSAFVTGVRKHVIVRSLVGVELRGSHKGFGTVGVCTDVCPVLPVNPQVHVEVCPRRVRFEASSFGALISWSVGIVGSFMFLTV